MEKETILAKIRATMNFSDETFAWLENLPQIDREDVWFKREGGALFFSEFRGTWEEILVDSSEPLVQGYFRELGIPENKLPKIRVHESYSGSWIIDAAIVMTGSMGAVYAVLKAVSELPKIADGLTELKNRFKKTFTKKANEAVNEQLKSSSSRYNFPSPPTQPLSTEFVVDERPLSSLTPSIMRKSKTLDPNSEVFRCVMKFAEGVKTDRGKDEIYNRVLDLITCLSNVFSLPDKIRKLAEKFEEHESILYNLSEYRDHFIHQAHVFLLGYDIINIIGIDNFKEILFSSLENKNILTKRTKKPDVLKTWFLASFFHDVAYAIEKTPILTDVFLKEILSGETDTDVPKITGTFNWGAILAWNDNRFHLNELIKCFYGVNDKKKKFIDNVLNNASIINQDHGVFSALILLNQLDEEIEKDPLTFYIAGLSIALHNKFVWENMKKEGQRLNIYEKIKFDEYPIPFLLMYCDNVQEWGRQIGDRARSSSQEPMLKGIDLNKNNITCTLLYTKQSLTTSVLTQTLENIINQIKMYWSSEGGQFRFFVKFCDDEGNALTRAI